MALPKGLKLYRGMEEPSYILAYGSNLLWSRMEARCPSAEVVGTTVIPGYRMLFKKSCTGFYSTIEQDANSHVPAVIYRISMEEEAYLDRCEGYPRHYYKHEFFLPVWDPDGRRLRKRRNCIAYILHEDRLLGEPTAEYYRIVEQGYMDWEFDTGILEKALSDSIGCKNAERWKKRNRIGDRRK